MTITKVHASHLSAHQLVWDNGSHLRESFPAQGHLIIVDKNRFFFQHYGLTEHDLERYLAAALSAGGEYADLYFEYLSSTSLMVDESMVKSASQGISAGCGVRVVVGVTVGVRVRVGVGPETWIVRTLVWLSPVLSVALIWKKPLPPKAGVPDRMPSALSARP